MYFLKVAGVFTWLSFTWGQILPHEELYFIGRVDAFGARVQKLYRRFQKSSRHAELAAFRTALAYALYQSEIHQGEVAHKALLPFASFLKSSDSLFSSDDLFYYHWVSARIARARGEIRQAQEALSQAATFARAPYEKALTILEVAENFLRVGHAEAAKDTLTLLASLTVREEPYHTYLRARQSFFQKVILYQEGQWEAFLSTPLNQTDFQNYPSLVAEYAYLQALAHLERGEYDLVQKSLQISKSYARKAPAKGKDLELRAEALRLRLYYHTAYRPHQTYKLRFLNHLLQPLLDRRLPTSYATVEAIEHLSEIGRITLRNNLTENVARIRMEMAEGLLRARLQTIIARVARYQQRGTIASQYSSQAVLRLREIIPFVSLEEALALKELGEAALFVYRYQRADTAFSQARKILHQLGNPTGPLALPVWAALSRYALARGQYTEAQQLLSYQRTAYSTLFSYPERNPSYLRNELTLAEVALRLGKSSAADTLLMRIEKPIEEGGAATLDLLIAFKETQGDLLQLKGEFRGAEKAYQEAIRLRQRYQEDKNNGASKTEGSGLLRLALLYQRTGRISRVRPIYQRLAELYERAQRRDADAAAFYIGATDFYVSAGDYLKAEQKALQARELNKELFGENSPGYVEALLASARVEAALGRYDREAEFLKMALAAQQEFYRGEAHIAVARTFFLLAQSALFSGHKDTAAYYLRLSEAEGRAAQSATDLEQASLLVDVGGLWLALDSIARAAEAVSVAKTIAESRLSLKHPLTLQVYLIEARLSRARGDFLTALHQYKKWINLWTSVYGTQHPDYPFHLAEEALLHWLARDLSGAKRTYNRAVSLLIEQVDRLFGGLTEAEKARYWLKARSVLEGYYAFTFSHGNPRDQLRAYEIYLTTKALILSETAQLRARLAASRDTSLRRLFSEWQDQKEYVVRLYAYNPAELQKMGVQLRAEEEKLNQLEKALTQYVGDIRLPRISWKALRSALSPDAAAIDWIRLRLPFGGDSVVYYAIITSSSAKRPVLVTYPDGKRMETVGAFRYAQAILNFETDTQSYRLYWLPVAKAIPSDISELRVSADGIFYQINLSTLRLPDGGFLGDKYRVIYHTRLASLARPQPPLRYWEGRQALLIADPDYTGGISQDSVYIPPLPGTLEEAQAVRDVLRSEGILSYVYTKREAQETVLYEKVSPYILHVATHGVFLPYSEGVGTLLGIQSTSALANPLFRSALLLADAGKTMLTGSEDVSRDGIANAYELLSLNLSNTELVVLSACETGLGDIQNGEGVYGLQRAFLLAGARHLVVSLWRVEDEATRDFMIRFYSEWLRKKASIPEAFWHTQRAMRTARKEPYFWGAFILVLP